VDNEKFDNRVSPEEEIYAVDVELRTKHLLEVSSNQ